MSATHRRAAIIIHLRKVLIRRLCSFRSTSALLTTFESRALPVAFLILLEGLLNTKPQMRPSIDRVMRGIREGSVSDLNLQYSFNSLSATQFDPLPFDSHFGEGTIVARRSSSAEKTIIQQGRIEPSPELIDDSELAAELSETNEDTPRTESPVLALPQPLPPPSFIPKIFQPILVPWTDQIREITTLPRRYFTRGVKSCVLLIKVCYCQTPTICLRSTTL